MNNQLAALTSLTFILEGMFSFVYLKWPRPQGKLVERDSRPSFVQHRGGNDTL